MGKNKAVRVLAAVSAAFASLYAVSILAIILFQGEFVRMFVSDIEIPEERIVPAGIIIRLICAAATVAFDVRLLIGKGFESNLYSSYATVVVMLIGGAAADMIYASMYNSANKIMLISVVNNLAVWVQPFLLSGTVMTIVACSVDVHINNRKKLNPVMVKTGLGLTAAYAVILLLVIILQKTYTKSDSFIFPIGCLVEFFVAICILAAAMLMLNGVKSALPLSLSAGAFIAGSFAETPMNVMYTVFLSRLFGDRELAALGMVSAYAGYTSYLFFAGAAVTIVSAAIYLYDKVSVK